MPPDLIWPLPCILCGRKPTPVFDAPMSNDEPNWQPYGATAFTSHGQYGSTVFDEMGREYLMVNICDLCMRIKAQENVIALAHKLKPPREPVRYEPWRPYEPEDDDDA